MAQVKVVFGSTYGNAQGVAENAVAMLAALGHEVELLREPQISDLQEGCDALLVSCASIGDGEIPENLLPFWSALNDQLPQLPDVGYGVIALGDSSYDHFAGGGHQMKEVLEQMQMKELAPLLEIDACETMDAEEASEDWLQAFAEAL